MTSLSEPVLETLPIRKDSPDLEADSGVDNTSESGVSCDDDQKIIFSSTESLEMEFPFARSSVRSQIPESIEPDVVIEVQDAVNRSDPESIAILQLDPPTIIEKRDDGDIDSEKLPGYFRELWLGKQVSTDFEVPFDSKPEWYNEEKFKRGQKFAMQHLFCINFAETASLFLIFSLKTALEPLIFTERSSTPFKACQRYLSTLTRVMSWYEGDPWSEGSNSQRHMAVVRNMHRNVQNRLMSATSDELDRKTTLVGNAPVWCTSAETARRDFQSACPKPADGTYCPYSSRRGGVWVNQLDMAITQFAFVGLVVTYPEKFGIHSANDDDLSGFLHVWRTLGHLLGIHDKYNFCNTDLQGVRQRTHDFINISIKPALREVTPDWEHMSRCLVRGVAFYVPGFNFDSSFRYLCDILNLHTPRLNKSLSYWHTFMYKVTDFTFSVLCRVPGLLYTYNYLMLRAIKKAQEASPETLSKWERTEFPYMKLKAVEQM